MTQEGSIGITTVHQLTIDQVSGLVNATPVEGELRLLVSSLNEADLPGIAGALEAQGASDVSLSLLADRLGIRARWQQSDADGAPYRTDQALVFDLCPVDVQRFLIECPGNEGIDQMGTLWIDQPPEFDRQQHPDQWSARCALVIAMAEALPAERALMAALPDDESFFIQQLAVLEQLKVAPPEVVAAQKLVARYLTVWLVGGMVAVGALVFIVSRLI